MVYGRVTGLGFLLATALGCGTATRDDTVGGADTGGADTGGADTGSDDTGSDDTGSDTGTSAAYGTISGDCGVLAADELAGSAAALYRNAIDFGDTAFDESLLGEGAQEVIEDGNLGGSSINSEAIAFEVLDRCEAAILVLTEAEIIYTDEGGKKTDLLVEISGVSVGVSVTRGYHYPPEKGYTVEEATDLLEGKLADVLTSAANADPANAWSRSALHVIAYDGATADSIVTAYASLDTTITADTLLLLTVTDGEDGYIY